MAKPSKYHQNAKSAEKYRRAQGIVTLSITCKESTRDRFREAVKRSGVSAEQYLNSMLEHFDAIERNGN